MLDFGRFFLCLLVFKKETKTSVSFELLLIHIFILDPRNHLRGSETICKELSIMKPFSDPGFSFSKKKLDKCIILVQGDSQELTKSMS